MQTHVLSPIEFAEAAGDEQEVWDKLCVVWDVFRGIKEGSYVAPFISAPEPFSSRAAQLNLAKEPRRYEVIPQNLFAGPTYVLVQEL